MLSISAILLFCYFCLYSNACYLCYFVTLILPRRFLYLPFFYFAFNLNQMLAISAILPIAILVLPTCLLFLLFYCYFAIFLFSQMLALSTIFFQPHAYYFCFFAILLFFVSPRCLLYLPFCLAFTLMLVISAIFLFCYFLFSHKFAISAILQYFSSQMLAITVIFAILIPHVVLLFLLHFQFCYLSFHPDACYFCYFSVFDFTQMHAISAISFYFAIFSLTQMLAISAIFVLVDYVFSFNQKFSFSFTQMLAISTILLSYCFSFNQNFCYIGYYLLYIIQIRDVTVTVTVPWKMV